MLSIALLFAQAQAADLRGTLNELAAKRDVAALSKYLAPYTGENPLMPIKSGGTYGVGRYGWKAIYLQMLNERFVVFSTDLTAEDIGELLFRIDKNDKLVYVPESYDNGEQIASHDFDVKFELGAKKAIVIDTILLKRTDRQTLVPMLRLGPDFHVSKIVDGQGQSVGFLQAGGIVFLPGMTSTQKLTIAYSGVVDKPMYAGSISSKEVMLADEYWYPMVARQPAPYTLTVTVPSDWIPVGQGDLVSETTTGDTKKAVFRMDVPVSYYSFSAAPYKVAERKVDGKTYRVWSNELTKAQMDLQTELYPSIIEFYSRFSKYPFGGYGAVVSRVYGGGALEAYSHATYGGFPGEDAHEPAHTWWGGIVDNSYLHSMWNESFADFCEGYYRRNVPIGNVEERRLAFIVTPEVSPAFTKASLADASPFIGPEASQIGYGKGAFVLQMLEQEIGSDKMLQAMQEWIRGEMPLKSQEWSDFEAAVDRTPGTDTPWFFREWVRRPGWVDFDVSNLHWGNGFLTGETTFKGAPYILHCEVLLRDENGKDRFLKAVLADNMRDSKQRFSIACPQRPALVSFDPWRRILRPFHSDERPVEIDSLLGNAERYTDPAHPKYLANVSSAGQLDKFPDDLNGKFIVGNPESLTQMRSLCDKVGFKVTGNKLTWRGTEIDLDKGAALAVVELGGGKRCVIGLGQTRLQPNYGRARTVLVDDLGRFLRGQTDPKTSGYLTFTKF